MGRFFDADTGGPLRLELRSVDGRDFTLLRRIGYVSDDHAEPFVVPTDLETFRTDLASVPWFFGWLVPRSGDFLPAAVLHDALVDPGDYVGPRVDRAEADRLFRVAMIELGTGRVRAWLMWAAATITTMWVSGRLRLRAALGGLVAAVVVLGLVATADLLDLWDVLPWMGERPWWQELVGGALAAVVIPSVLALSWGRERWRAGVIAGVALALLLHVTIVLAALYAAYRLLERVVSGPACRDRGPGARPGRRRLTPWRRRRRRVPWGHDRQRRRPARAEPPVRP